MRRSWMGLFLLLAMAASSSAQSAAQQTEPRWYRGNTHTHTLNSDGDSTPDEVVRWYRQQRYHFLVVTDHNFVTPVAALNELLGAEERFVVISGEEVSDAAGKLPVHVNALGATATLKPQGGATPADVLKRDVDAVRAAGSLAQVNHPNFGWALTAADMEQAPAMQLLEVFNGHPTVNNLGGGGVPAAEAMWDTLLSAGRTVYAVASDDVHHLRLPVARQAASPGRGWVMVRARRLSAEEILGALSRGDFYATTGVELTDVKVMPNGLAVTVKEQGTTRYRIQFIGRDGRLLKEATSSPASYEFSGGEGYVRAKILDSNGYVAWTQPVRAK